VIGRPHIARAVVEGGYCSDVNEVFRLYLGDNGPAFVAKDILAPSEAIREIHRVGGIAYLAHPSKIGDDDIVEEIIAMGIDGLEVYYLKHSYDTIQHYAKMADDKGLMMSGGTDLHDYDYNNSDWNSFFVPKETIISMQEYFKWRSNE